MQTNSKAERGAYVELSGVTANETVRLAAQAARWHREPILQLRHALGTPAADICDLGCGPGAAFAHLSAAGFRSVVGVDTSPAALELAGIEARARGLEWKGVRCDVVRSAAELPPDAVAAVFVGFLAMHVGLGTVLRAARRLLHDGGLVAVSEMDHGSIVASGCAELLDLVKGVQGKLVRHLVELSRPEPIVATEGFSLLVDVPCGRWLSGRAVLEPYDFIPCMNDSPDAAALKELHRRAAASPTLADARIVIRATRFIAEKQRQSPS